MLCASARTAGTEASSAAACIIGSPPWWWRSMSWRKTTSSAGPVEARSRARSSGDAMPGIVGVGMPIQPMNWPDGGVSGSPHRVSQPCMRPTWAVWVDSMSNASWRISGFAVLFRAHTAISTPWPWWTSMSCRKPTSIEPSAGP
jgi:hypothetical protein